MTIISDTHSLSRLDLLLHHGWSVEAVSGPVPDSISGRQIPASVPGSIHTDLLAAGLIPDPYLDDNERLLAWIGICDWRYSTLFRWDGDDRGNTELVFEGLDTIATINLNGADIASTVNMHRTYRFDVRELLVVGANTLTITFESAIRYADRMSLDQGYLPHVNHHPYNAIRKMACSMGWDWGIDTATVGIWKPITLSSWATGRLDSVRPTATVDGDHGTVVVAIDLRTEMDAATRLTASLGSVTASVDLEPGQSSAELTLSVPDVERWWPRGHGDQPLYDLDVILTSDEERLDSWNGRVGFRSVRIDTEPDEHGTPFTFVINDRPIVIRGANWIPDDAFPHRVDRARYAERIDQAQFANINLLRVWGGGIYESDDFFGLCDERGMLTWQDFLFACAAYSEDDDSWAEVEAEARDNISRLMPHPSLVMWNGSNENIWGREEWGWGPRLGDRDWGLGYYLDLLPRLVGELDPGRPYTPSSPFSPDRTDGGEAYYPNDPAHGSTHFWETWNRQDYPVYRSYTPRFVGEFGWQGPPTWSTLVQSISDSPLTPESPGMLVHQKAQDGNVKLIDGLVAHLPLPDDMEDWHWAMSLNQAIAVGVAIDHFRSLAPVCMGSIVWQLNDCWPVTSWAAVDGYGRAKPLLYAIAHSYADRLISIQPRDSALIAAISNDTDEQWSGEATMRRLDLDGQVLASATISATVGARQSLVIDIPVELATAGNAAREVLEVRLGEIRGLWFFAEYRDSELGAAQLTTLVERVADGYTVEVTAQSTVRDVALLVDKLDDHATVDDQLVTLLPGDSVVFRVTSGELADPQALVSPRVLRSANQLLAGTSAAVAG
ncbi:beta-mannosidase [Salinibacterium sp. CAN_S4]|uniref:glycoside hydrolase family 2 protein n=1 Tax=Salinibacterium sp. CAN_S4 TaxID=2787727 RepID=UPI001A2EAD36